MPSCSGFSCKNRSETKHLKSHGISYHTFPKDVNLKKMWFDATGRPSNWFPTKNSTICSIHFEEKMFQPLKKKRSLFKWAIPKLRLRQIFEKMEIASDNIQMIETPRKRNMRITIARHEQMLKKQRSQIKRLPQKTYRYRKKISNLKDILTDITEQKFVNSDQSAHLENLGVNDLIARYKNTSISNRNIKKKYSPALRAFACTLHFYSPKGYEYVRQKFQTCLPHSRTIKKWYESVDAQPGFTQESFKALTYKARNTDYKLLCNLVVDEMAIMKRIEWDGKKMHEYVDICSKGISGDYLEEAKEVLVFLVTAINAAFKIPVGYFLVAGVTGEQRSNLVKQCLELLHETGIEVTSRTFDGCPANISMAKELGCSLNINNIKTYFHHPITNKQIFIFPDPCHMLKLLRNALEAYCNIYNCG
ncbi:unnamed protein product [Euphydryas editha]|uniref:THAP-type domain-containing protein n=1 Tax=Euphydryas editha TaxID=104508 RepID=A0AAU9VFE1_EUPED|nr:unnamed protein product [Euphydryas editha]